MLPSGPDRAREPSGTTLNDEQGRKHGLRKIPRLPEPGGLDDDAGGGKKRKRRGQEGSQKMHKIIEPRPKTKWTTKGQGVTGVARERMTGR
jgi:hypothetical protein